MNIRIPLHHDRQLPIGALKVLGHKMALHERATLIFTMCNLADTAGRKNTMRTFPKDAVFGGFTADAVKLRLEAAYGKPDKPPELTKKQQRRADTHEAYRDAVLASQPNLTNYEQSKFLEFRRHPRHKGVKPEQFVGCRERIRAGTFSL